MLEALKQAFDPQRHHEHGHDHPRLSDSASSASARTPAIARLPYPRRRLAVHEQHRDAGQQRLELGHVPGPEAEGLAREQDEVRLEPVPGELCSVG